ncbi:hypothetical protein BDAP_001002 [Binucleata daphniae]
MMYKCRVKIIPYVMTWDGIVTKFHKKYVAYIGIHPKIEAYIQSLVLRKTLESLSFEMRRGFEEDDQREELEAIAKRLMQVDSSVDSKTASIYKYKHNTYK